MNPWELIIMQPMINVLIVLSHFLFDNFGLTIIVLTIIIRGAMYPLTVRQLRASRAMQELQPKLAELQKKYGKDKKKLGEERMKLMKETGVSPLGCMIPMLIQLPVWIALYQSIIMVLAAAPEGLLNLSRYLYSWPMVYSLLPLNSSFLWLDLASPDRLYILPLLVGGTMWVQQKMVTPTNPDPRQQTQSQLMLWMMPLMFAFFSLSFPSGLALYWVTSNIISIIIQYFVGGWGGLVPSAAGKPGGRDSKYKKRIALEETSSKDAGIGADISASDSRQGGGLGYEESGDKRQDRGGSYPASVRDIRRQSRRRKSHRSKRK